MQWSEHALDRSVAVGFDAEIVEHDDNGLNMWANTRVGGEVTQDPSASRRSRTRPTPPEGQRFR